MTSQNELFFAQQQQLGLQRRQMAQMQHGMLGLQGCGILAGMASAGFGASSSAAPNRTLKSDFEEYMRECRREFDLG